MADNTKEERIPLLNISVTQKFSNDLYYSDFLLHPKDVPTTEDDLSIFRLWQVDVLEMRGDEEDWDSVDDDFTMSALSDSLSIIERDIADMLRAQKLYQEIYNFVSFCYQTVSKQLHFPIGYPLNTIKQFIEQVRHIGFPILRFQELHTEVSYIEVHSTNSLILTIALANAAKMPQHRLLNLALSSMFHEVGLVKFANLVNQNNNSDQREFQLQKIHVQEALNLLKIYQFPSEVIEGILQHHERLDGSGYPNGLAENEISNFGRYLGLVCSYVTMTTDHEFGESCLAHRAILTLLKGAKSHYDSDLVRLLVQLLSLYPVGSYVTLSNGLIGRVFRNNQKNPRLPIIQVLLDQDYKLLAQSTVIQTNEKISVAQPISYKKIVPLIAQLQENKS